MFNIDYRRCLLVSAVQQTKPSEYRVFLKKLLQKKKKKGTFFMRMKEVEKLWCLFKYFI